MRRSFYLCLEIKWCIYKLWWSEGFVFTVLYLVRFIQVFKPDSIGPQRIILKQTIRNSYYIYDSFPGSYWRQYESIPIYYWNGWIVYSREPLVWDVVRNIGVHPCDQREGSVHWKSIKVSSNDGSCLKGSYRKEVNSKRICED